MTYHHEFQSFTGNKADQFRRDMAKEMRRLAEELENGSGFVVLGIVSCNYDSEGGPMVIVDRDCATVELIDEMSLALKHALFEGLE